MRILLSIIAAVLAAAGSSPAWAATSSTVNLELPMSATVTNPCNGETIDWQGTAHFIVHETSAGREILVDHVNFQDVQGQGSFGNSYRMVNSATFEFTRSPDTSQGEFTATAVFLDVSQGSAPDFASQTTLHLTLDASGQPTASVVKTDTACRG